MKTNYIISRLLLALIDINNAIDELDNNAQDVVYCHIDSAIDNLKDILSSLS